MGDGSEVWTPLLREGSLSNEGIRIDKTCINMMLNFIFDQILVKYCKKWNKSIYVFPFWQISVLDI